MTPADLARAHLDDLAQEHGRPPTGDEVRARMRLLRDTASELAALVPVKAPTIPTTTATPAPEGDQPR